MVLIRNAGSIATLEDSLAASVLRPPSANANNVDNGSYQGRVSYAGDCSLDDDFDDDDDDDEDDDDLSREMVADEDELVSCYGKDRHLAGGAGCCCGRRTKRTRLCLTLALVAMVAAAVIAGIVVGVQSKQDRNRSATSEALAGGAFGMCGGAASSRQSRDGDDDPPRVPTLELHFRAWTIGSDLPENGSSGNGTNGGVAQHRLANETEILILEQAILDSFNRLTDTGCADWEYGRWMVNVTMVNQTLLQRLEFIDPGEREEEDWAAGGGGDPSSGGSTLAVDFEFESTLVTVFETQISCLGCDEPTAFATVYPTSFDRTTTTEGATAEGAGETPGDAVVGNETGTRRQLVRRRLGAEAAAAAPGDNGRNRDRRNLQDTTTTTTTTPPATAAEAEAEAAQQQPQTQLSAGRILSEISRTVGMALPVDEFGEITEAAITTAASQDGTVGPATVRIKGGQPQQRRQRL